MSLDVAPPLPSTTSTIADTVTAVRRVPRRQGQRPLSDQISGSRQRRVHIKSAEFKCSPEQPGSRATPWTRWRPARDLAVYFAGELGPRWQRAMTRRVVAVHGCGRLVRVSDGPCSFGLSHQPAVLFSQNKSAISNQPTVLFSQNKLAPAISQPNRLSRTA
jgi:hypothetical protein